MNIFAETINAKTQKEYIKIKNNLIKDFKKFNVDYSFIESEYNSDNNGYIATVTYTL